MFKQSIIYSKLNHRDIDKLVEEFHGFVKPFININKRDIINIVSKQI